MTTRTITISLHAISRWRERAEDHEQRGTDTEIRQRIGMAFISSREVRLKHPGERANKLATHGPATFHHFGSVVLVLSGDSIVSVYGYVAKRWEAVK